jgi:hypothetical protein
MNIGITIATLIVAIFGLSAWSYFFFYVWGIL